MKKVLMGCTFALAALFATDSMAKMEAASCDNVWATKCAGKGASCVKKAVANCVADFNKTAPPAAQKKVCDKDCLEACDNFALNKGGLPSKVKGNIARCIVNAGPQGL